MTLTQLYNTWNRSIPTPDANCQFTQREQINQISSYIDGTTVYGVDDSLIKDIRDPESDAGELKVGTKYSASCTEPPSRKPTKCSTQMENRDAH